MIYQLCESGEVYIPTGQFVEYRRNFLTYCSRDYLLGLATAIRNCPDRLDVTRFRLGDSTEMPDSLSIEHKVEWVEKYWHGIARIEPRVTLEYWKNTEDPMAMVRFLQRRDKLAIARQIALYIFPKPDFPSPVIGPDDNIEYEEAMRRDWQIYYHPICQAKYSEMLSEMCPNPADCCEFIYELHIRPCRPTDRSLCDYIRASVDYPE